MPRLIPMAGAVLAGLFIAGFVQSPVIELNARGPETDGTLTVSTEGLESLPVTDRSGIAEGRVVTVLRRPDDSVAALEIAWSGPGALPGMTIEHATAFFDYRPEEQLIRVRHSWSELIAGYRAASALPAPEPPRAGTT